MQRESSTPQERIGFGRQVHAFQHRINWNFLDRANALARTIQSIPPSHRAGQGRGRPMWPQSCPPLTTTTSSQQNVFAHHHPHARYLAREAASKRFAKRKNCKAVDDALGKEGWKIIELLRLSRSFHLTEATTSWSYLDQASTTSEPASACYMECYSKVPRKHK